MKRYALRTKHSRLGGTENVYLQRVSHGGRFTRWTLDPEQARTWPTRHAVDKFKSLCPHIRARVVLV